MTRPKVPDDKRIRTAQACESCKRRKQKVSLPFPRLVYLAISCQHLEPITYLFCRPGLSIYLSLSYHLCMNISSLDAFVLSLLCMDVSRPNSMRMPLSSPSTLPCPQGQSTCCKTRQCRACPTRLFAVGADVPVCRGFAIYHAPARPYALFPGPMTGYIDGIHV